MAADRSRSLTITGALLAVLGVLAILFPYVTGVSLSLLLGAVLVVGSVFHFANAFSASGWTGAVVQVLVGILYVVAGISLMANPVVGLATLTILLVAYFVVEGLLLLYMGLRIRPEKNWGWTIVSGALSLLVAWLIWASFPSSAAWAIGLLFGINLLSTGIAMVMLGRGSKETSEDVVPPVAPGA